MQTEPSKADPPKRKRRWLQFSLRSLLLAVLIVAIGMAAWIVPIKNRAQRQKEAVDAILKGGGFVVYDYQEYGERIHEDAKPPGPDWLRKLLGDDVFTNVIAADVESNDGLERLRDLTSGADPGMTDGSRASGSCVAPRRTGMVRSAGASGQATGWPNAPISPFFPGPGHSALV